MDLPVRLVEIRVQTGAQIPIRLVPLPEIPMRGASNFQRLGRVRIQRQRRVAISNRAHRSLRSHVTLRSFRIRQRRRNDTQRFRVLFNRARVIPDAERVARRRLRVSRPRLILFGRVFDPGRVRSHRLRRVALGNHAFIVVDVRERELVVVVVVVVVRARFRRWNRRAQIFDEKSLQEIQRRCVQNGGVLAHASHELTQRVERRRRRFFIHARGRRRR